MKSPRLRARATFLAAEAPRFGCVVTDTPCEAKPRAIANVSSVEPSSTTMISVRGHVWASADWIVSAIQRLALNAGMRIETRGCIKDPYVAEGHVDSGSRAVGEAPQRPFAVDHARRGRQPGDLQHALPAIEPI